MSSALNTKYNPSEIEAKWQEKWEKAKLYQPDLATAKRPYYNLHMFPYPSAEGLHVGNVYAFTGADIYGRFKRMQGNDVFQPFGLDGFGIHSENYALKVGTHPMDQAEKSEGRFYTQVRALGSGYDWSRTLETYDPDYYRWTQWLFTELFKSGLAYRESVAVNFCPSCKTVLADEQVIDGKCERCSTVVEKKDLEQWMFRITEYAEQLLSGLDKIDWTEKVKIAQRNWIGKSEGATVKFRVVDTEVDLGVFTTRPDTLYGVTFLVVSPEHPVVERWLDNSGVKAYVQASAGKSEQDKRNNDREKTGVFSGAYAINPINNQHIPVWIADYVLMSYGTGAIMAVPAHDERDFAFAKKYHLPITQVVSTQTGREQPNEERRDGGCGVVFDPASQRYAVATHPDGLLRLFAGGVAEGEDLEKGIIREVTEESGLHDFGHIERIQTSFTHFYNSRKKVNRSALATCYLAILKSTNLKQTHLEEHEKAFELAWKSADEILENWSTRNDDHGLDHWVDFMIQSVGRAIELGHDTTSDPQKYSTSAYIGSGVLINSGSWSELEMPAQKDVVIKDLQARGIGSGYTNYHLRDWLISRQRYWGPPIPMIYCQVCFDAGKSWFDTDGASDHPRLFKQLDKTVSQMAGWYPEENLPVELPHIDDYKPIGTPLRPAQRDSAGQAMSPLGNHPEFYEVICPECGAEARRETDVSDTFLDSSWYFLRYLTTDLTQIPFPMAEKMAKGFAAAPENEEQARERMKYLPVTIYTGGAEHSVLHLLYTRFFYKVLVDLGYIDKSRGDEPFPRFFAHGLIIKDGSKMSKSKGNVIIPDSYIEKFGADTLRSYLMFLGPFDMGGDFRDSGIEGMNRFIKRVWTLLTTQTISGTDMSTSAKSAMNEAIRGVTLDIESFKYNTAIAKIMTYYNFLSKKEEITIVETVTLLKLLAPFAPHMTEELYQTLELGIMNNDSFRSIHLSAWPEFDKEAIENAKVVIAVQINGKLRGTFELEDSSLSQVDVEKLAHQQEIVERHLQGENIKKVIYIPGKILNFVVT